MNGGCVPPCPGGMYVPARIENDKKCQQIWEEARAEAPSSVKPKPGTGKAAPKGSHAYPDKNSTSLQALHVLQRGKSHHQSLQIPSGLMLGQLRHVQGLLDQVLRHLQTKITFYSPKIMYSYFFHLDLSASQARRTITGDRETSLQKKRDDSARRRSNFNSNATDQEREAQREYERNKKRQQRANETLEQREDRLQKMKEYKARINSTEDGMNKRVSNKFCYTREYDRIQRSIQRERETPEQREERLQKAREYKTTYKPKSTVKEKDAKREYMAAMRANRTEEKIAQDREAARQRMANVRSRMTVLMSAMRRKTSKESVGWENQTGGVRNLISLETKHRKRGSAN